MIRAALSRAAVGLSPYLLWIKLGAAVLALVLAGAVGWRLAEAGNAAETRKLEQTIAGRDALIARKNEALRNASRTFLAISARARALSEASKVAAAANDAAAEQASRDYEKLVDSLSGLDKALEAAKRRGGKACAAQLEEVLCVPLE